MDVKIQGVSWFPEDSISRYIFPVGKFAYLPFLGWETENCVSVFQEIELFKINSREFMSQTIILSRE